MFKLSLSLCLLNVLTYAFALHNFLPNQVAKRNIYTNFVPPSAERFFTAPSAPSTKQAQTQTAAQPLLATSASAPYLAAYASPSPSPSPSLYPYPYPYQTQYSPVGFKQYQQYPNPYYPGVFYPPQQYVYPAGAIGPSPVVYVPRYPVPAESGNEQGSSSGGQPGWGSYFPSNWQSWGSNWGSYFPSWSGSGSSESAEGATPGTPAQGSSSQSAASASSATRAKPEKLEQAEATPAAPSQDSAKLQDADKNAVTVQLPEQQYVLLGQPQFFGHFAAFPADRDPTTLNGAAKGAVSSFLFYNDQNQQVVPQRFDDISNTPASASIAYQRFLLLSKQRSEDGPKPANKSESQPSSVPLGALKEASQSNSNSTSDAIVAAAASASPAFSSSDATSPEPSPAKSSADGNSGAEIAQVTPNAFAYAGIGGVAGAAPIGTAFIANSGLASSAPRATAIAGTSDQSPDFTVVPAKTISIARYTPQRKYHIDTVAHRVDISSPRRLKIESSPVSQR